MSDSSVPAPVPAPKPPRRPRYPGKNPRRFEEKYKEHRPERYAADVAKVIAAGKTPAGSHRPILVAEVLAALNPSPGERGVDATLGYGGHATELLKRLEPGGHLLALDVDPIELPRTETRLREAGYGAEVLTVVRRNFAGLSGALAELGWEGADFILADLGVSSMQVDNPARGFTYKWEGPFDLRLNPQRGQPASVFVAGLSEEKLAALLRDNADEPQADRLAPALVEAAAQGGLETTVAVAEVIRRALSNPRRGGAIPETDDTIRRVFQAVRIAVNDEFGALDSFLRGLPGCLNSGGRVAILTFHSGEDRRVKRAFGVGHERGDYARIADEVLRPCPEEIRANPRAKAAKLRWAQRV